MANLKLSAQLYTLHAEAAADLPGVLKSVAAIGFAGVELAGYGNLKSAAEVRSALDAAGLKVSGAHVGLDALRTDPKAVAADQKTLGNVDVIMPYVDAGLRKTAADWLAIADTLNIAGRVLAKDGLRLSYHNHAFEFASFDGQTAMDLLLQHADPAVVGLEVDVYWVAHAGHDPVQFLESLGKRLRFVHLKDRAADGKFAPVGTGTLDFPAIVRTAEAAGVEWGVVEQDDSYGQDPLNVLKTGFESLKRIAAD